MNKENNFLSIIKHEFSGFSTELIDNIRERHNQDIDDAVLNETLLGIDKATVAMLEVGVDEKSISAMLIKHWDLRPSEANSFIDRHRRSSKE